MKYCFAGEPLSDDRFLLDIAIETFAHLPDAVLHGPSDASGTGGEPPHAVELGTVAEFGFLRKAIRGSCAKA